MDKPESQSIGSREAEFRRALIETAKHYLEVGCEAHKRFARALLADLGAEDVREGE